MGVAAPDEQQLRSRVASQFGIQRSSNRQRRRPQATGSFEFTKNPSHNIQLSAEKVGVGRSRIPVRLYFQSEDIVLKRPLQLSSADADSK